MESVSLPKSQEGITWKPTEEGPILIDRADVIQNPSAFVRSPEQDTFNKKPMDKKTRNMLIGGAIGLGVGLLRGASFIGKIVQCGILALIGGFVGNIATSNK